MYRFMPIPDAKPSHRELNPLTSSQYTETAPSDYPSHQTNKLMTTQSFHIGERPIGIDFPPYLIAELSGNHNKSIERSRKILQHAASSGADAIKLQTYTPDTMTLNVKTDEFYISDKNSPWYGRYLYELYEDAFTPWEWHEELMHEAHRLGLTFFSTPFDESAVEFLEQLDVPCFKIASFENNHIPLIEKVSQTGKPLMISTGLSDASDIADAVGVARANGCTGCCRGYALADAPWPIRRRRFPLRRYRSSTPRPRQLSPHSPALAKGLRLPSQPLCVARSGSEGRPSTSAASRSQSSLRRAGPPC